MFWIPFAIAMCLITLFGVGSYVVAEVLTVITD